LRQRELSATAIILVHDHPQATPRRPRIEEHRAGHCIGQNCIVIRPVQHLRKGCARNSIARLCASIHPTFERSERVERRCDRLARDVAFKPHAKKKSLRSAIVLVTSTFLLTRWFVHFR